MAVSPSLRRFGKCDVDAGSGRASVKAVQPSSAHLTRAGYLATPAKAIPSPRRSSSPGSWPLEVSIARMPSYASSASRTEWPVTCSDRTEADATLIEQPSAS